jgi:hypothetical protein
MYKTADARELSGGGGGVEVDEVMDCGSEVGHMGSVIQTITVNDRARQYSRYQSNKLRKCFPRLP